jgi:hypothetical protein
MVLANVAGAEPSPDTVLTAAADSYVDHDRPTVNFGQSRQLLVGGASWSMSYVRFQLPARPAGQSVTARLVLHYADRPSTGTTGPGPSPSTLSTALAGSWWSESGIDAANGPTPGYALGRAAGTADASSVSFDVSRAVRGRKAVTLAVWGSGPASAFASRESGSGPQLLLWTNGQTRPAAPAPETVRPNTSDGTDGAVDPTVSPSSSDSPSPAGTPSPSGSASPTASPSGPASPGPSGSPSPSGPAAPPQTETCPVSDTLVPSCGAWWGVAANPLGGETWDQALGNFESEIGRSVDIAHYYHKAPELFPTTGEIARAHQKDHERILYLNWKPEMGRSWAQVAAGDPEVDAYIDKEATYLKQKFTDKFFMAIHHEPEDEVNPAAGSGFTAKDFAAMYRHVVERLRADGVRNAVFVLNYLGTPTWGSQPWFNDLYPGDDVVDWIAEDPYVISGSGAWWATTFGAAVDRKLAQYPDWPGFYSWAKQFHPDRPIMLGEWGVDEEPQQPDGKADFFLAQMGGMQEYPNVKALVYWNSVPIHPVGITRIDSSQPALGAYRQLSEIPLLNQPLD